MSDEATIEDEADAEQPSTASSRPETKTGLLPWSYIFEMGKFNLLFFFILNYFFLLLLFSNEKMVYVFNIFNCNSYFSLY